MGTHHAVPFYKNRERRSYVLGHMLVNFGEIEVRAQELFGAWLSKIDQLHFRPIIVTAEVGGLHHRYDRQAAVSNVTPAALLTDPA